MYYEMTSIMYCEMTSIMYYEILVFENFVFFEIFE